MTSLDRNSVKEANAAIVHFIDWQQAFDRQCPKLAINSFIKNGVRKSLIPVLTNYFQDRKMQVKWHGEISTIRNMPGGGPQGCILGQISYTSQSTDSGKCVQDDDRFKFVDDLSLLEIINLILAGLEDYNTWQHVPSDMAVDTQFLPSQNCDSQEMLNQIADWTVSKKMKLNEEKSKYMVVNFTKKYQFSARSYLNEKTLEQVEHMKVLGTIISSDLSWHENTQYLVQKAYKRLQILRKLYEFQVPIPDLVHIYTLYVRSVLEFNSCVWHFSITEEESQIIERVQKNALKLILKDQYFSYENALETTELKTLEERRQILCKRFAIKCTKNPKTAKMFPLDTTRHSNKFKVTFARNSRFLYSAIPQMQRILNSI